MTTALLFALMLQQAAANVVWSDDPPVVAQEVAVAAAPVPDLPAHALADPYGWERSQCSPFIRKDEPLEHCQARVRVTLAAAMGDRLPEGLRPSAALENCTPGTAANGYAMQCGPRPVAALGAPPPLEKVCDNRPQRTPSGAIAFNSECRPTTSEKTGEVAALRFRLGRD
jgi:hypothetical protein